MCADTPETVDYKSTLNLPQTDFPMRAGLPKREPEWLARWEKMGIYNRLREKAKDGSRKQFTLHDGPPYANGHLHIGHALNKTIKDMIVRSHQMMGFDARYIPGWDCHGLPIEWKIEEQYRKKGRDKDQVPINEFRGECREFARGWVDIQREEFKRLGITGNWENPYLTMDFHAERVIAEEFMKFLMTGTLYQGSKPVMWSPVEQTALAEAEVEYHDKESFTVWVKFRVVAEANVLGSAEDYIPLLADDKIVELGSPEKAAEYIETVKLLKGAHVVIWTTTPWTMPSNKAVVFGDGIKYGLYEVTGTPDESWVKVGERYLLAADRAAEVFMHARLDDSMWNLLRTVSSEELSGLSLLHPLAYSVGSEGEWDEVRDFRAADFVTDTEGTGFVHCAPSHGLEEYDLYRDLGMLEQVITYNVMPDGRYRDDLPFFGGKAILKPNGKEGNANAAVIDKLVEVGGLLARGKIKHSYPHSWRSKAPVIYRNTPQWFAAIDRPVGDGQDTFGKTIRERALTEIDNVNWTPKSGRNRLHAMMEARPDWVLSRQRAWGVPLTCFTRLGKLPTDADFLLRNVEVNQRIVEAFEVEGADAWYEEGAKERFLGGVVDPSTQKELNPDDYNQVTDILDVWFDSGSTHAFTLRDREDGSDDGIADVYMEGTDQHRGWFHSSLLQSCGTYGRAPYRNVVTHGFTLDSKGMKMSKSIGNTIEPKTIIEQSGADILRLWVAQADYTADQRIGPEILKGTADSYRRLRNTMRYMLGALSDFTEADRVEAADMPELERWVLHRLAELDTVVRDGYARFDFQGVFRAIFEFATLDLSAFYFDIRKDALYCDGDTPRRRAARTVLDLLFHRLTTWLAPVLVFTMEEVWLERMGGEDSSVHLQDFPATPEGWLDADLAAKWARIREFRRQVTGALEFARQEKRIGSSLEAKPVVHLGTVVHHWPDAETAKKELSSVDLADICIVSQIEVSDDRAQAHADGDWTAQLVIDIELAEGEKCARCWKVLPDVGTHTHAGVCARCDEAV
jgi:isoleucyl-tRNA synthetase